MIVDLGCLSERGSIRTIWMPHLFESCLLPAHGIMAHNASENCGKYSCNLSVKLVMATVLNVSDISGFGSGFLAAETATTAYDSPAIVWV